MKKFLLCLICFLPLSPFTQASFDELKSIIKSDDVKALQAFLDDKHSIDDCYEIGESSYSILVLSIKYKKEGIFKKCLELKADLDKICEDKTPLMYAIKYGRMEFFHALLEAGANKEKTSKKGKSAAEYATKYKREYFMEFLD
ncbi:MAG: ankyrin repeat domain-containing protein [Bacteroidota bacterium]